MTEICLERAHFSNFEYILCINYPHHSVSTIRLSIQDNIYEIPSYHPRKAVNIWNTAIHLTLQRRKTFKIFLNSALYYQRRLNKMF